MVYDPSHLQCGYLFASRTMLAEYKVLERKRIRISGCQVRPGPKTGPDTHPAGYP